MGEEVEEARELAAVEAEGALGSVEAAVEALFEMRLEEGAEELKPREQWVPLVVEAGERAPVGEQSARSFPSPVVVEEPLIELAELADQRAHVALRMEGELRISMAPEEVRHRVELWTAAEVEADPGARAC
jgi:hypothetical protein